MDDMPHVQRTRGAPLPASQRAQLAALVQRDGEQSVQRRFRLSRSAIYRALAGLGVIPGTAALIERGLEAEPHHAA